MARRDKRLAAMRQNPRTVHPDDLDRVLADLGFTSHQEGSHKTYRHSGFKITIPQRKPHLKPTYVRAALDLIDDLGLLEEADE